MRPFLIASSIAAIVLGIFFRIYHADWKLYNPDEANTSLRISGHTNQQFAAFLNDGKLHRVSDLDRYALPTAQTSPGEIWHSLASEDPQHPPLFFLITFAVERVVGDAVFVRRLPALAFGILALVAAWWFGRELFADALPAWCLTALVAVSPFQVAFAQEAREYSLFLLTTCLSSALLLRALRTGAALSYVLYALSVCAAFWSFTLFVLVAAAQALYLAAPFSTMAPRRRLAAFAALLVGSLTFTPWLANLVHQSNVAAIDTQYQATALTGPLYAGKFLFNLGTVFFDLDYVSLFWLPLTLFALVLAAAACFIFFRRAGVRSWFLPLAIAIIGLCATVAPDLLRHETRALQNRYLTAVWLAVEIATAGGFCIALQRSRGTAHAVWRAALIALLLCGTGSNAVSSQARTWWTTGVQNMRDLPAIIDALRGLDAPTIVYTEHPADILMLQPYATPPMRFRVHASLDRTALRSAAQPYAIVSPEEAGRSPVAGALRELPLIETFEMRPDPAIDALRRRGAAARGSAAGDLDLRLYGATAALSPPSP